MAAQRGRAVLAGLAGLRGIPIYYCTWCSSAVATAIPMEEKIGRKSSNVRTVRMLWMQEGGTVSSERKSGYLLTLPTLPSYNTYSGVNLDLITRVDIRYIPSYGLIYFENAKCVSTGVRVCVSVVGSR